MEYFDRFKTWPQARQQLASRLPAETLAALDIAADFAIACHGDQMRPSIEPVPYAEHLVETLDVLVNGVGVTDCDVLIAALLHDVVEDTPCTEDEVRTRFGPRVATLVGWVTKGEDRVGYLRSLRDAPPDALLVKLADRVSNVQHLENFAYVDKRGRYYRETVEHILPLADRHEWFRDWFAAWREEKKELAAAP
jgi:(p)ppGpp synthase/HD superfamily hydrolase